MTKKPRAKKTREQWLREAARAMAPWIREAGKDDGAVYPADTLVSVGWPRGGRSANDAIGQCWQPPTHVKGDNQRTIFISPELVSPVRVVDVLLHEMIHASLPMGVGHSGPFRRVARALGLDGPATATEAKEGSPLHAKLVALVARLGPYNHVGLKKGPTGSGPSKGQSRWVRLTARQLEGYHAVISLRSLADHGMPTDPDGTVMVLRDPRKSLPVLLAAGVQVDRRWLPLGWKGAV